MLLVTADLLDHTVLKIKLLRRRLAQCSGVFVYMLSVW